MDAPIRPSSIEAWFCNFQCCFKVSMVIFNNNISIMVSLWEILIPHHHILHFGTHFEITYDQKIWTFGIISISFNNSSFANSRGVFQSSFTVSCMICPIFFKTSTQITTSLILMHVCCYQALLTCQKHKNIFVFGKLSCNETRNII